MDIYPIKMFLFLLTAFSSYYTTVIVLLIMDGGMDETRGFPLTRQLLEEMEIGGSDRQLSRHSLRQDVSNLADNDENGPTINLASQFRHFRLRHERRRMNRVKEALIYLRKFGYLEKRALTEENVEAALKSVQEVLGVRTTGELDKQTISGMRMPRCGNPDVLSPIHSRRLRRRFAQMSRWVNKMDEQDVLHLQWFIEKYTKDIPRDAIREVIKRAFKLWTDQVTIHSMRTLKLDFMEARDVSQADINIVWAEGEHGDAYPFDGPGNSTNVLAHTFYPNYKDGTLNGDIHFDDYETWVLDNSQQEDGVRFPYVLVHEIGHALGVGHSSRQEALMNPIYKQTPMDEIALDIDDKCAVNWNYIGPTRTCLFIWLLTEYLPKAKESNSSHSFNSAGNESGSGSGTVYTHTQTTSTVVGEQTVDDRVRRTLDNLQRVHIPKCTLENNLQHEYELLLINKLEFPADSAQRYGPVVCNFLDGLREIVTKRRRAGSSVDESSSTSDTWMMDTAEQRELVETVASDSAAPAQLRISSQPLVHSYSSSPYADEQYSNFHTSDDSSSESISDTTGEEIFSYDRRSPDGTPVDIFSRDYFDDTFFQRLLRLVVSSHWSRRSGVRRASSS